MIKLVICDLDNTLYDWVGYFVPAFNAMLKQLVETTDCSEADLLNSFRRVHQSYGTSEYALAVAELDVLTEFDVDLGLTQRLEKYSDALAAFREGRRRGLCLYPDVADTLRRLRQEGRTIVAHTDAMSLYARARLRQLGIEKLFDGLWALTDHDLPAGLHHDELRRYFELDIERRPRLGREVSVEELKPDPAVVREILEVVGVASDEALYIGDSLTKDVLVAQRAGVVDVYAAYGRAHQREQYQRLVDVTHWTEDDVQRERQLREHQVQPTFIAESFSDLLRIVDELDSGRCGKARLTTQISC